MNAQKMLKNSLAAVLAEIIDDISLQLVFTAVINQLKFIGVKKMIITNEQFVNFEFKPVTIGGNPATLDGAVLVESSDPNVATAAFDGEFIRVQAGTSLGQCIVTVKGDADLGEGVREIVGMMDITVVQAEASTIVLSQVGDPQQILNN